jgi:hypothetical protein
MDKLLVDSWKKHLEAENKEDAVKYFNMGRKIGNNSPIKTENIKDRNYLMSMNLSWFNVISRKYRPDIIMKPVVAFFNIGEIDPIKVYGGKCGAGSEIALVKIAEELAKREYNVYVFHGGDYKNLPCKNPQYLPIFSSNEKEISGCGGPGFVRSYEAVVETGEKIIDHLILWRQRDDMSFKFNGQAKRVYLGCHDFAEVNLTCELKALVVLTESHKNHFQKKLPRERYVMGCNGTMYNQEVILRKRENLRCCYASSYARGLKNLLEMWPKILKVHPKANLNIYYGRETFGVLNDQDMDKIVKLIENTPNVVEHGKVSHEELVLCLSQCSFLLYPYVGMSETFSITTATSMQVGCIPVVRKKDALVEVMCLQEPTLMTDEEFCEYSIDIMGKDEKFLEEYRQKCKSSASKYTHESATDSWEEAFCDENEKK